jgi:hypothetical protein
LAGRAIAGKQEGRSETVFAHSAAALLGRQCVREHPPRATNFFNFVVATAKPLTTSNLTAKVSFSRVVLEGGKLADASRDVQIERAEK